MAAAKTETNGGNVRGWVGPLATLGGVIVAIGILYAQVEANTLSCTQSSAMLDALRTAKVPALERQLTRIETRQSELIRKVDRVLDKLDK